LAFFRYNNIPVQLTVPPIQGRHPSCESCLFYEPKGSEQLGPKFTEHCMVKHGAISRMAYCKDEFPIEAKMIHECQSGIGFYIPLHLSRKISCF
jgi:hypothetical protein